MKILKTKSTEIFCSDLINFFHAANIWEGNKFGVSWKIGKRRKLRSYKIYFIYHADDDYNGPQTSIRLLKGINSLELDNIFGISSLNINSL